MMMMMMMRCREQKGELRLDKNLSKKKILNQKKHTHGIMGSSDSSSIYNLYIQ